MTLDRMFRNELAAPPALLNPPSALVIDGQHQLGSFDGPVPVVNPLDVVQARGWRGRRERFLRNLRMKEWEAFQLGNAEWFVLGAVYDAKAVGLVMVIAVHQETGRILRWIDKVPSRHVSVARGLQGTASKGRSRRSRLVIANAVAAGRITLAARHSGRDDLPPMQLSGVGACAAGEARHLAACHPFGSGRILYTNKCLMPFRGELRIGDQVVAFEPNQSFMILDDHHGEYPWPQVYDWVTAARCEADGSLLGFNLTANQVHDPATYNENVLWMDGALHRLPAVRFERPLGVHGPWRVTDTLGAIDVTFTPTVRSALHVGPRHSLAEYYAPYGRFAGHIAVEGRVVSVDGLFGMGEKKRIRF